MKKRLLSMILAVSMVLTFLPLNAVTAFAEDSGAVNSTFTVDGITYKITKAAKGETAGNVEVSGYTDQLAGDVSIPKSVKDDSERSYSVTSIGRAAFKDCSSLTSVTIPEGVTKIGGAAFYGCSSLTRLVIPNSVTWIQGLAFYGCSSLTSVTISNNVKNIPNGAFKDCSSLTSVTIPDSVTSIDDNAFGGCAGLTTFNVAPQNEKFYAEDGVLYESGDEGTVLRFYPAGKADKTFTIPDSVTSIGSSAFYGCSGMTGVTIPDSITSIGSSAFSNCTSLTSVTIPNRVTSIGNGAFSGCKNLTKVTIPDGVTSINRNVFYNCSGLTSVTIPDSVTLIDDNAFSWCNKLEKVYYTGTQDDWEKISGDGKDSIAEKVCYRQNITVPKGVAVKAGEEDVTVEDNNIKVYPGTEITLTVSDPKYRDAYEWHLNDDETKDETHVSDDGKTFTITVEDSLNKIGLQVTRHETYDADDFTVTGLRDYIYGETIEVKVNPKDASVGDYTVEYVKDAGTDKESTSEDLPTKVGTYTVRIKKGNDVIDIPQTFTIKPRISGVSIKSGVLQKVVLEEEDITESITKDADGKYIIPENAEVTVAFDKDAFADSSLKFSYWNIEGLTSDEANKYNKQESFTFTMPATGVTLEAMTQDATIEDPVAEVLGTTAMVTTAVVGTAVLAYTGYQLGTEFYLICLLPSGAAIPANTAQLAKLVWTDAGRPAPAALLAEDATEEQQAMAWAVENELIDADKAVDASVSRIEVIKTWKKAQKVKQG